MSHTLKRLTVPGLIIAALLLVLAGCGDDTGVPFKIKAYDSVIDWTDPAEDGISLVGVTIFDDEGVPVDDGTMFFTVNDSARGYFLPDEDEDDLVIYRIYSVDVDDGVAEAVVQATKAPETIYVKAYCPFYSMDETVSTSIRVLNDTMTADFYAWVDEDNSLLVYVLDASGFPDGYDPETDMTWTWNFGDGTTVTGGVEYRGDYNTMTVHEYALAGTYDITLTVATTDGAYSDSVTYSVTVE